MALGISIEYCNQIYSWLDMEYACKECFGDIFSWCENKFFHIPFSNCTPIYDESPCKKDLEEARLNS